MITEGPTPATIARSLYPNQGLHSNAAFIAELHPNAIDYLRQAPVLALCFGAKAATRADRLYVASRIGGPINRGERLRNVMAAIGVAYPLRKLAPFALSPKMQGILRSLCALDSSTLSQAIPDKPGQQRKWLKALQEHRRAMAYRGHIVTADEFRWFATQSREVIEPAEASEIADYIVTNGALNWDRWTWDRARREVELWHDRLATERDLQKLPGLVQMDTCIDLSSWPDHTEANSFEIFKLATPGMIMEEGRRMRHCVGSYIPDVLNGRCSLFSIRQDMRRVATAEIVEKRIRQIKGFANKRPPAGAERAMKTVLEAQ